MNEPRTDFGKALYLVSMPLRIIGILAVAAGQSLACAVGTAWRGPDGVVRWRR